MSSNSTVHKRSWTLSSGSTGRSRSSRQRFASSRYIFGVFMGRLTFVYSPKVIDIKGEVYFPLPQSLCWAALLASWAPDRTPERLIDHRLMFANIGIFVVDDRPFITTYRLDRKSSHNLLIFLNFSTSVSIQLAQLAISPARRGLKLRASPLARGFLFCARANRERGIPESV